MTLRELITPMLDMQVWEFIILFIASILILKVIEWAIMGENDDKN